jgi:hypothetical protein
MELKVTSEETVPVNEKSKIDAANAGAAVAVKSAVKAASKRCLIAVPSKCLAWRRGTLRLLFNCGGDQALVVLIRHENGSRTRANAGWSAHNAHQDFQNYFHA